MVMGAPIYSLDDIMKYTELRERTNVAAEELESIFLKIQQDHMFSKQEVLFTLARVVDSFIRMEEDFCFDESQRIDAEAVFNDYLTACRDIGDEDHDCEADVIGQQGS